MESNSSARGEPPKPGCDGATISACSPSAWMKGRSAATGVGPCSSNTGMPWPTWTVSRSAATANKQHLLNRFKLGQLWQHFVACQDKALLGFGVCNEPLARHHDQATESADPLTKFLDLSDDCIRVASKELSIRDQVFGSDVARRTASPAAPRVRRDFRTYLARQKAFELRALLEADGDEPGDFFGNALGFGVAVADITERHVGKPVLSSWW